MYTCVYAYVNRYWILTIYVAFDEMPGVFIDSKLTALQISFSVTIFAELDPKFHMLVLILVIKDTLRTTFQVLILAC